MRDSSRRGAYTTPRFRGAAKIAIVGSINRDEVWDECGGRRKGWGGILYNIAALAKHAPVGTTILPIAHVGRDARAPVGKWLRSIPQIDDSGLLRLDCPGNLCRMRYVDPNQRREKLLNRVPAIPYRALRLALSTDLTLVNFISGADVAVATLERFRREFQGLIYMDIHSYLLGRREDMTRFVRRPADWRRVVSCADILQMNELEFATLSRTAADSRTVSAWVGDALTPHTCRHVLVTLGASGAFCVTRARRGWRVHHFRSGRRTEGADPTGCGDTFTGLWLSGWLKGLGPLECTRFAAHGAARPIRPNI